MALCYRMMILAVVLADPLKLFKRYVPGLKCCVFILLPEINEPLAISPPDKAYISHDISAVTPSI